MIKLIVNKTKQRYYYMISGDRIRVKYSKDDTIWTVKEVYPNTVYCVDAGGNGCFFFIEQVEVVK